MTYTCGTEKTTLTGSILAGAISDRMRPSNSLDFRAMEGQQIPGRYETPGGMLVDAGLEALLEENTHPIEVAVKVNASMVSEEKLEINGAL